MTSATLEKRCTGCGSAVKLKRPKDASNYLDAIGVICIPCSDRDEAEERAREERVRHERFAARVRSSNLPARWHGLGWDGMDTDEKGRRAAVVAAKRWSRREGKPGLMLVGNVGTGKTRLAGIATWHRLARERTDAAGRIHAENAIWVSVPVLIAMAAGGFQSDEKREAVRVLTEGARTLILDDIDKVKAGEWVSSQLFAAIDSRVAAGSGLLVTANLRPDELAAKFGGDFGEAIVSRLMEHCDAKSLVGRDRRQDLI